MEKLVGFNLSVIAEIESEFDFGSSSAGFKKATGIRIIRLKPGQSEAIGHLLNGRDVLGVLPIGYGKSLIYHH